jgi:nucleoside-diphosphate-sugar epimerase
MKRVLVTGASGFIGRHTLRELVARGFEVHAVARAVPASAGSEVQWHSVDLLGGHDLLNGLIRKSRPSHLLHLAWYTEHGQYWQSLENFRWAAASLELAHQFARNGGQRIVVAGTCAEYEWGSGVCDETSTPLIPSTTYGVCKDALRRMLEALSAEKSLSFAWGRVFFVFGPGEDPRRLLPSIIRPLLKGVDARTRHGREHVRDFLAVQDVAEAFVALLDSVVTGGVNIASGKPLSVADIGKQVARIVGGTARVQSDSRAEGEEPETIVADVRRLYEEVGWFARATMDDRIRQTVDWWRGQDQSPN